MISPTAAAVACLRLQLTRGIGGIIGRRLLDEAGSAEQLWRMTADQWRAIEGVGNKNGDCTHRGCPARCCFHPPSM